MDRFARNTFEGETPSDREFMSHKSTWCKRFFQKALGRITGEPELVTQALREVEKIDEVALLDILRFHLGKAGLSVDSLAGLELDDVKYHHEEGNVLGRLGAGGKHSNQGIEIDLQHFLDKNNAIEGNKLFHALLHETLHRLSKTYPVYSSNTDWKLTNERIIVDKSGLETAELIQRTHLPPFNFFDSLTTVYKNAHLNEGLTELLTQDIADEYYRRTGESGVADSSDNTNNAEERLQKEAEMAKEGVRFRFSEFDAYVENQVSVYYLIIFYSLIFDVPEEVILDSFVRAYFRNGSINIDDMFDGFTAEQQAILKDCLSHARVSESSGDSVEEGYDLQDMVTELVATLPDDKQVKFERRIDDLRLSYRQTRTGRELENFFVGEYINE